MTVKPSDVAINGIEVSYSSHAIARSEIPVSSDNDAFVHGTSTAPLASVIATTFASETMDMICVADGLRYPLIRVFVVPLDGVSICTFAK